MVLGPLDTTNDNQGVDLPSSPRGLELYARFKQSEELTRGLDYEPSDDDALPKLNHGEDILGPNPFDLSPYKQMFPPPLVGHSYAADILNASKPLGPSQSSLPLTSPSMLQKQGVSISAPQDIVNADGASTSIPIPPTVQAIRTKRAVKQEPKASKASKARRFKPAPNLTTEASNAASESSTPSVDTTKKDLPTPIPCCALATKTFTLSDGTKSSQKQKCISLLPCDKDEIKEHFNKEHQLDINELLGCCPFKFADNKPCNDSFVNLEVFARHLLRHFHDRPKVPCKFLKWGCKKGFSRAELIKRHIHESLEGCVGFQAWQEAHPGKVEPKDRMVEGPSLAAATVDVRHGGKRKIAEEQLTSAPSVVVPRKKRK